MDIFIKVILVLLVGICLITDTKYNRIYNKVLLPFIIIGILLNLITSGLDGGANSLLGGIIPIIVFYIFFMLRMLGAGDIKLFTAIGCLMGWNFILNNIIYTFFIAGIMAILIVMRRKNFLNRMKYLFSFLHNYLLGNKMLKYDKGEGSFPFAVAIFFGTILQLIVNYKFI